MALENIIIPQMGESINEVTLIKLYKKIGDTIKVNETIADLATDKVDTELIATFEGVIVDMPYTELKTVIPIGGTFLTVETNKQNTVNTKLTPNTPVAEIQQVTKSDFTKSINPNSSTIEQNKSHTQPLPYTKPRSDNVQHTIKPALTPTFSIPYLSPIVCKLIFENEITTDEIKQIQGTGTNNRITKKDIINYISHKYGFVTEPQDQSTSNPITHSPAPKNINSNISVQMPQTRGVSRIEPISKTIAPPLQLRPNSKLIPIERKREAIIKNLVHSKEQNVQVTLFVEADVTNIVAWRRTNKQTIEEKYNLKITYTPLIATTIVQALLKYPALNNVILENEILERQDINLGIATAQLDGNLIVPIIKQAQTLTLLELARQIQDLVQKARNNQLTFKEIDGGTFTLTNIGTFNGMMGTPLLPPNQSAILATGVITKKIILQKDNQGNEINVPKDMMYLSLSFDHRLIDGMLAGNFLNQLKTYLQDFDTTQVL